MNTRLSSLFRPIQGNGRVAFYRYIEKTASPLLRPYVSCYWMSEPVKLSERASNIYTAVQIDRVLPDGCTDIIFTYHPKQNRYSLRFIGAFADPFAIVYEEDSPIHHFGVRFFPGGAFSFLRTAMAEFSDSSIDLELVLPESVPRLNERLFAVSSMDEKVEIMEEFLISQLRKKGSLHDDLMANLLHRIFVTGGKISVRELAGVEYISERHMNRKFAQWIGLSPKKFSQVVRFQTILNHISRKQAGDWESLALEHGYFDTSHLIHDFIKYYGATPAVAAEEFQKMSDFYNPAQR
ncbi:MAG TPA: helix-turn-helix domain-containing protein [Candidatus Bathyarchaeia archaeon]|nr:helix-turn-helix domain-containing protein [Candidatus Bathyarchaeia archaeon]